MKGLSVNVLRNRRQGPLATEESQMQCDRSPTRSVAAQRQERPRVVSGYQKPGLAPPTSAVKSADPVKGETWSGLSIDGSCSWVAATRLCRPRHTRDQFDPRRVRSTQPIFGEPFVVDIVCVQGPPIVCVARPATAALPDTPRSPFRPLSDPSALRYAGAASR